MKIYFADLIPKIKKFSKRLDDLTLLMNQHWISLDEINDLKRVFIFRNENTLLISTNGNVEKARWEYLGNDYLLLEMIEGNYLFRKDFFDENIIAFKLDSTNNYIFFINETKYYNELNNIEDVLKFLEDNYSNKSGEYVEQKINLNAEYGYKIVSEKKKMEFLWGDYIEYEIKFASGHIGKIYKGGYTEKYFHLDILNEKIYFKEKEDTIYSLYLQLKKNYS